MNREQLQLAHLLWTHFGLNPIDYAKLAEDGRAIFAKEIYRMESDKRKAERKAK